MVDDDQKLERLIKESLRLSKENNRRLRSIQRGMFLGGIFRLLVWAVILGLPIFIYFSLLKPYIDGASSTFEDIKSGDASFFEALIKVPSFESLKDQASQFQAE